jgi:alpha-L-fucosidase
MGNTVTAMCRALFTFFCALICTLTFGQQAYFPDPDPHIRAKIAEWQDLKFGLLMHWGPYSQWGVVESWSICPEDLSWAAGGRRGGLSGDYQAYKQAYEGLKYSFYPNQFDPDKWAAAAQKAGMKYVIFTTKHHDGFCMFDTKTTDYKITSPECRASTLPQADVTLAIMNAFRKQDFWTGLYFSKPDWHSDYFWWKRFPPADRNCNYSITKYPERWELFKKYTHTQIDELMSHYGNIDILWLDGGWVRPKTDAELQQEMQDVYEGSRWARNPQSQDIDMPGLVREARAKQPNLIVVDRAVPGIYQNYLTPEQHIPEEGLAYPWETCMTMGNSWSYVPDEKYKSVNQLLFTLVDVVSKGGNLLLNIGPGPDGTWQEEAYSKLDSIGDWMAVNGDAIYNTRPYKVWHEGKDIRFTTSKDENTVYVFLLDPASQSVQIKEVNLKNAKSIQYFSQNGRQQLKYDKKTNSVAVPKSDYPIRVVMIKM